MAGDGLWTMMSNLVRENESGAALSIFQSHSPDHQTAVRIGGVRRMALDAARGLLEEGGPDALHLRTIATQIGSGVSTLYHHFADKNALLSALAIEGFQDLERAMVAAMAGGKYPRRIDAVGAAYIQFLYDNMKLYALMHAESVLAANEDVRDAERQAFKTYQSSLVDDSLVPPDQVEELSLVGWTLGRGTASVILSQGPISAEEARGLAEKIFRGFRYLIALRTARAQAGIPSS